MTLLLISLFCLAASEHTSLLVGCITLAIIVIAVAAIAIAAISVAAYFAKERIKRASCKVYCQSNEQPSSSQNDSGVEVSIQYVCRVSEYSKWMPIYGIATDACSVTVCVPLINIMFTY